jgi:hypothetical protein
MGGHPEDAEKDHFDAETQRRIYERALRVKTHVQ